MVRASSARDGFSLVEVLVATVILAVGFLAMAATTGVVLARVRAAGLETERAVAMQEVSERLRSTPFDEVTPRDAADPLVVGDYRFWWSIVSETRRPNYMEVLVVSEGRGVRGVKVGEAVQDTFTVSLFR